MPNIITRLDLYNWICKELKDMSLYLEFYSNKVYLEDLIYNLIPRFFVRVRKLCKIMQNYAKLLQIDVEECYSFIKFVIKNYCNQSVIDIKVNNE